MTKPRSLFDCRGFSCFFDHDADKSVLVGKIWLDPNQFRIAQGVSVPFFSTTSAGNDADVQRKAESCQTELFVALNYVINQTQFTPDTKKIGPDRFVGIVRADIPGANAIESAELTCEFVRDTAKLALEDANACREALLAYWRTAR